MIETSAESRPSTTQRIVLEKERSEGRALLYVCFGAYVFALFLIPDRYTIPIAGDFGIRVEQVFLIGLCSLLFFRFLRGNRISVGSPIQAGFLLVAAASLSLIAHSFTSAEGTYMGSVRVIVTRLLQVLAALAVATLADNIGRRRLVLGIIVCAVAASSVFAIREAATGHPVRLNPVPSPLQEEQFVKSIHQFDNPEPPRSVTRLGLVRPTGAAATSIELSAVMSFGLALALYLALSAQSAARSLFFLGMAGLTAVGMALSISRTGLVVSVIFVLVAAAFNLRHPRRVVVGALVLSAMLALLYVTVPQSVTATIEQATLTPEEDPSLATRTKDYEELDNLLGSHVLWGRGPGAPYIPRDGGGYILDNQYLSSLASTGLPGLIALLILIGTAAVAAFRRVRASGHERGLGVTLLGVSLAFGAMCAFFDTFAFQQISSLFMLCVGLVAAPLGARVVTRRGPRRVFPELRVRLSSPPPLEMKKRPDDRAKHIVILGTMPFSANIPLGDWHMTRALAREHQVLYVDPPASPVAPFRGRASFGIFRRKPERRGGNLYVGSPIAHSGRVLPRHARIVDWLVAAQVRRWLKTLSFNNPIVISFSARRGTAKRIPHETLVYWQKDRDWARFSGPLRSWLLGRHWDLLADADLVVGVSPTLVEDNRRLGVPAVLVPNGCDAAHFGWERPEPPELAAVTRPRAIIAGAWNSRVDTELVDRLARLRRDMMFIIVGQVQLPLPKAPNVIALGPRPYGQLPAYIQHCDVGLVPYVSSVFNEASCPLKVFEYLASGIPVLTTGVEAPMLPRDLVVEAGDADEAAQLIGHLALLQLALASACKREAARNSWSIRAEHLIELVQSVQVRAGSGSDASRMKY